jgi:hypothetical protein
MNLKDKFGRKWLVSIEHTRRGPALVGAIIACFDDPLRTPQKYMTNPREAPYTLTIDYVTWAADQAAACAEWDAKKDEAGRDIYEERFDPDKPVADLPGHGRELLRFMGTRPTDPSVIERAAAGDKDLLFGPQPVRKRAPTPARVKVGAQRSGPRHAPLDDQPQAGGADD